LARNWLIRGEYLHYDFGSIGYAFQPVLTLDARPRSTWCAAL
jgi:hypothetical protein